LVPLCGESSICIEETFYIRSLTPPQGAGLHYSKNRIAWCRTAANARADRFNLESQKTFEKKSAGMSRRFFILLRGILCPAAPGFPTIDAVFKKPVFMETTRFPAF
jgi:hypothetical protein